MGIFSDLKNECLIRELQRELNTDILLFGFDGHVYFGNLQRVDDCRTAVLTPAIKATVANVEILTAGGDLFDQAQVCYVDLWSIVAKGTGIAHDPIYYFNAINTATDVSAAREEATEGSESLEGSERTENRDLIRRLRRMIGEHVAIGTLGGFLFQGIVGEVEHGLAILVTDDIFPPGINTSISSEDVRSVVINLEAITSVSPTFATSTT